MSRIPASEADTKRMLYHVVRDYERARRFHGDGPDEIFASTIDEARQWLKDIDWWCPENLT